MSNPYLPGKFVWFEHICRDPKRAQAFYGEVVGWKVESLPMGDFTYDMIKTATGTVGGYAQPKSDKTTRRRRTGSRTSRCRTWTPRSRRSPPPAAR
jgi:predicted enzyme related to lactoylglutathione lyase